MGKTIGFMGGGMMAEGIIKGLLSSDTLSTDDIFVREILTQRAAYLKDTYGLNIAADAKELADESDIIVLAVRPQEAEGAAKELKEFLDEDSILVSICAGLKMEKIASWVGADRALARIMPNTMTEYRKGCSAIAFNDKLSDGEKEEVKKITDAIGETLFLPESQFDAFTAASCAGAEWIILFAAAVMDAGVEIGISRENMKKIVTQNLIGVGMRLAKGGENPFAITDEMNTPGGIGIAGYHVFMKAGIPGTVMDVVEAAYRRTVELGG